MSPDITPVLHSPTPVDLIREAVNAATKAGVTVSTVQSLGVHCTSTHAPTWERDGRTDCVSPLGAVLLVMQPPVSDVDAAVAHALGVSTLWAIGFDDGCSKQPPSGAFAVGPAKLLYAQGFEAGTTFRAALHRRQGVPVERSPLHGVSAAGYADAASGPTRIEETLDSLSVSEGFEKWADSLRRRADKLPADQADELNMAEAMLREFAVDLKWIVS